MKNLVIIPAFNEQAALPQTLRQLQALPGNFEILVVNDGSADETERVAREAAANSRLRVNLVSLPLNSGIGVAMQTGYLFAEKERRFEYAIQFDADGQHDAGHVEALVAACRERQLDICIGSRFLKGADGNFQSTFTRRLGIKFFSRLISMLSRVRVTDPTSGFRCAGPRAWSRFARHYPEDYPEPESLFWCARNKLSVGEIPVRMHERQGGVSSIRYLKTVYYMLKVSVAILVDRLRKQECEDEDDGAER